MPQGNSALRTNAGASKHPARTVAGTGQIVEVTLRIKGGVSWQPLDLIDALEAKYGAGKVASDRDTLRRGNLQLVIG